jgi:hypothetical protein
MKNRLVFRHVSLFLVLAVLVGAAAVFAQETTQTAAPAATTSSDDLALKVADAAKANQAALTKYSWKAKADLAKDAQSMATSVSEMRFNTEGKLEVTNVGGESNVDDKRGVRGRKQEKGMEDFAAFLEGVLNHSFKYIFMSKGTLVDVFDRAKIEQAEGSVNVAASDVYVKGDKLNLSVDPASNLARTLNFTTTLGQDTITGKVTYGKIENGPNRPVRLEIEVPTQAIKIVSETYDWIEQK